MPEDNVETDGDATSAAVPEAAVEITCEANASKSNPVACVVEEKASLISELPVDRTNSHKASNSKWGSSNSTDDSRHNRPTVQAKPVIQTYVTVSAAFLILGNFFSIHLLRAEI